MTKLRTCTAMVYTDGTTSRYAVFVGKMKGRAFSSETADIVAIYEIRGKPDYAAMTARHASNVAPAVPWQCQ